MEDAEVVDPFRHQGWMSLEISVENVDALRPDLEGSPFRVIGEPANLDVSDDIRAMQAIGPAGEVLYLTEIKAEVPPFELPFARCAVDRLFIPVLLAPDRERALVELARCELVRGRVDRARKRLEQASGLVPADTEVQELLDSLGRLEKPPAVWPIDRID